MTAAPDQGATPYTRPRRWQATDDGVEGVADPALFDIDMPPPVALADQFIVPPFSVLPRYSPAWQERKRKWLSLGIRSEVGRDGALAFSFHADGRQDFLAQHITSSTNLTGTSIFDPVLCELAYRWYTAVGDKVLDPFAGGSVRGITASVLHRRYLGVELRHEQVQANLDQLGLAADGYEPEWINGDARAIGDPEAGLLDTDERFDFVFSCPPYADLEVYSDDPRDLSNMSYEAFRDAYEQVIATAVDRLRPDRFIGWVISDVRDKRTGAYRGLESDTIVAFGKAGARLENHYIIPDSTATAGPRAGKQFSASRRAVRIHQSFFVFVKGDAKRAAQRINAHVRPDRDFAALPGGGDAE